MDGNAADHRHQSPPSLGPPPHAPWEMASLPIPDELLREIFLHLPTPADLVRASAACVSFRRVVADRSFLRRYRKLHAPPLLGFLSPYSGFHPAVPPHPSASAASAVALAADFSFTFVPAPDTSQGWVVRDIRDGRFLLATSRGGFLCGEMVVCDPLHRRYILVPPIPDDLAAMVANPGLSETFLVPRGGGHDDEAAAEEETSFRVMGMVYCEANIISFVFSSSTRQWRAAASRSWIDLLAGLLWSLEERLFCWRRRQYVYGCFYWIPDWEYEMKMLVLDTRRMEFSFADPPSEAKHASSNDITMIEAGEGKPGMLIRGYETSGCIYTIWRNNGGSSSQWRKEKKISPSLGCEYMGNGSMGKYLVLNHLGNSSLETGLYMLDIKTLQLERVCASIVHGFAYSNYPPSLSSPTISSGVGNGAEEMVEQGSVASSSPELPWSE
ncbi:hypothetical protein VPH35_108361 [Triticum aestivum]|uniref:F-box domain-containing protein n=4 Tax=Triticum TaxID=4564 RepID=A0A9R0YDC1_TRITD|nr:uncharacterized protein LOC123133348 [Triticum aestivum]VAI53320.1 unnamed protein product [Triticum turgidum subsp. durum]